MSLQYSVYSSHVDVPPQLVARLFVFALQNNREPVYYRGAYMGTQRRSLARTVMLGTGTYLPSSLPAVDRSVDHSEHVRKFLMLCIAAYAVDKHSWIDANIFEWRCAFTPYPASMRVEILHHMETLVRKIRS
jgi:hypothetical protein